MKSLYNIGDVESTLKGALLVRVFVQNREGKPLMPTTPARARKMLKCGKAVVVKRTPFTVRLNVRTKENTQPITLGVDAGSKVVGISASTVKKELYSAEATLRNDIVKLLSDKRQYRRTRRNRLRYRKPRFLNLGKEKGWLAPSIRHKIASHIRLVREAHKILPIARIIVEVAAFDIQKIKHPDISGSEYQQGEQLGFWNIREYVLFRDDHKCQHCKGKSKDKILNVHHIESRKTGGDAPSNLITLCETCHQKHHKGEIQLKVKRGKSFRDAAFMGIMRWAFYTRLKEMYPNVSLTYGYITKHRRINAGIEKSHSTDAYCIAGNLGAIRSSTVYNQRFVRRHNRQLHKATIGKGGYRKANQAPRYVFGYQLFDKVVCNGREGFVFGRRARGSFDIRTLDGEKLSAGISYKKLRKLESRNTLLTERGKRCSSPCLKVGVSAT